MASQRKWGRKMKPKGLSISRHMPPGSAARPALDMAQFVIFSTVRSLFGVAVMVAFRVSVRIKIGVTFAVTVRVG